MLPLGIFFISAHLMLLYTCVCLIYESANPINIYNSFKEKSKLKNYKPGRLFTMKTITGDSYEGIIVKVDKKEITYLWIPAKTKQFASISNKLWFINNMPLK